MMHKEEVDETNNDNRTARHNFHDNDVNIRRKAQMPSKTA